MFEEKSWFADCKRWENFVAFAELFVAVLVICSCNFYTTLVFLGVNRTRSCSHKSDVLGKLKERHLCFRLFFIQFPV